MSARRSHIDTFRLLPRGYVALWLVLATLGGTYLTALAINPEWIEVPLGHAPLARSAAPQPHETPDLRAVRQALAAMNSELQALRNRLDEREKAIAERLAEFEARRHEAQSQPIATASVRSPAASAPHGLSGEHVAGKVREPTPTGAPPPPTTLRSTPVLFGEPEVRPEGARATATNHPIGVEIATGPTADALRISWMVLSERHKAVLKDLEPRIVQSAQGTGPHYRLVVGPLPNEGAAQRVCAQLRQRRVPCGSAAFEGEPF